MVLLRRCGARTKTLWDTEATTGKTTMVSIIVMAVMACGGPVVGFLNSGTKFRRPVI